MSKLQFRAYNQEELFRLIDGIEISKVGEQVVTKYFNHVKKVATVSNRYEIFDIRSFLKDKITSIAENFNIFFYKLSVVGGRQQLTLLSDKVEINGGTYHKTFFILNSSDKSRRLSMNLGLYHADKNTYFSFGATNMSFSKKHLTGVTQAAEDASFLINGETFDEQIEAIKSLVDERVKLSNVRDVIVGNGLKVDHMKFDSFKRQLFNYNGARLTQDQLTFIRTSSETMEINQQNDFSINAFAVFNIYMQIFRNQDSYVIKKETDKIMKITQCFIRNERLNQILDMEDEQLELELA